MVKRTRWDSRTAFVLAAIGSAIGLGNIWRFPYICYKYGGGAFLIPYFVALLTAGIPLLILEFAIGHRMEGSAPLSFAKISKKTEWLGWFALLIGFGIVCYYAVIMAWSAKYLISSFTLAWGADTKTFFFSKVLNISGGVFEIGRPQGWIVLALFFCWICIVLATWKGIKTVGKVVYVTVTLPWVLLIIFVIRGLTLPGAMDGIRYFLTPNFKALANLEVWHAAYSQIFFTLTVGFGVMIAYASFLPRKSDIVNNALIISLSNCATSYIAGFAVFSTLGYYAHISGTTVANVMKSGPELAFVTYPTIINHLPLAPLFGVFFFLMLLTLGIDSAFSLTEAIVAGVRDKFRWSQKATNITIAGIAFVVGLIFTTRAGLYWLDIVDHFMNNFGLFIVGFLEAIFIGYIFGADKLRKYANNLSELSVGRWWDLIIRYFVPIVSLVLLIWTLKDRLLKPYGGYSRLAEFLGGWLVIIIFVIISILLSIKGKREV
ncbi:sodium-dependent transporter [candidate division WOR-3 bacterium]|nr:sodium-dependent transporter [candidate division WOR-3 bacterium]